MAAVDDPLETSDEDTDDEASLEALTMTLRRDMDSAGLGIYGWTRLEMLEEESRVEDLLTGGARAVSPSGAPDPSATPEAIDVGELERAGADLIPPSAEPVISREELNDIVRRARLLTDGPPVEEAPVEALDRLMVGGATTHAAIYARLRADHSASLSDEQYAIVSRYLQETASLIARD